MDRRSPGVCRQWTDFDSGKLSGNVAIDDIVIDCIFRGGILCSNGNGHRKFSSKVFGSVYSFSYIGLSVGGVSMLKGNATLKSAALKGTTLKGSATIEMAYIMPLFLWMFLMIMTAAFYFHDKVILYAAAYETAVTGAELERREESDEVILAEHFQERIKGKLIFFSGASAEIEESLEKVTVRVSAQKGKWKIQGEERAAVMRPEILLRHKSKEETR